MQSNKHNMDRDQHRPRAREGTEGDAVLDQALEDQELEPKWQRMCVCVCMRVSEREGVQERNNEGVWLSVGDVCGG